MIIPTNLLHQAYPTLRPTHRESSNHPEAAGSTCRLANPTQTSSCGACIFYSGDSRPGCGCALKPNNNPDLDESWSLFYETYPKYLI